MKIDVLDHGYVEFIEPWGTGKEGRLNQDGFPSQYPDRWDHECGIIEAARMSTQGNFRGWDTDRKLLQYLYDNHHNTPFEFAGMIIEVQAPLFVFREWHRHRTQWYNEMSARYTPLPELYYHCHVDEVILRAEMATTNKQAGSVAPVDKARITNWVAKDIELTTILEAHYQEGLAAGVPKELARKKMPVDHYSRMRAGTNLRNWLAFMTLRCDPKAQREIRMFANAVAHIIEKTFPNTYSLWAKEFFHTHA
jgi:thymidylate synthase (FAD)